MQYRMFTNSELKDFRAWMGDCPFDRSPQGAFEAKLRRARDEEEDMPGKAARRMANILLTLRATLGDEGFKGLCSKLCNGPAEDEGEEVFASPMAREQDQLDESAKDKRKAMDDPEPFKGCPKTGAAMDAMAFDKRPAVCRCT